MNNQNAVANPLVKKQMIPPSDLWREPFYGSHTDIKFCDFIDNFSYNYPDTKNRFMNHEGVTFQDHVGFQLMTGNELLYYPILAKELRKIKDYPVLKRSYEVDKTIEGMPFIEYFYYHSQECFNLFQDELEDVSLRVNSLTSLYGQIRFMPLIDSLELVKKGDDFFGEAYVGSRILVINGVKWLFSEEPYKKRKYCIKGTNYLDLRHLLTIANKINYIFLEKAVIDTPFIALRLAKTWYHKGHTRWYSLDTRQQVSKAEVIRWKKSL